MTTQIDNTQLLADSGLKVVHVRRQFDADSDVTVAYRETGKGGRIIEFSTAITNPGDTFTKKIGTKLAIENFLKGARILIPDQDGIGATRLFRSILR